MDRLELAAEPTPAGFDSCKRLSAEWPPAAERFRGRASQLALDKSPPNENFLAALAHLQAKSGQTADARRILVELESRTGADAVSPFFIALVYAGLRRRARNVTAREVGTGTRGIRALSDYRASARSSTPTSSLPRSHGEIRPREIRRRAPDVKRGPALCSADAGPLV